MSCDRDSGGKPSLVPASDQNGSHEVLGLNGLELGFRAGCVWLDSSGGTEKLTHGEAQLQERGALSGSGEKRGQGPPDELQRNLEDWGGVHLS